jgi:hypothetical protein
MASRRYVRPGQTSSTSSYAAGAIIASAPGIIAEVCERSSCSGVT